MKLTAEQIKKVEFSITDNGYSPKEVDDFLDKVINDYEEMEDVCFDDRIQWSSKINIGLDFDGVLNPDTVEFEGTVADWIRIENKGIFANVPCINCKDGQYIQKL